MAKKRLDILLVDRDITETREKAKRLIMAGLVFSNHQRMDKPGDKIDECAPLTIKGKQIPYVGRGGLKLEKALDYFSISVKDRVMIDVGSSTGGFTDCALQRGAKISYAIDVGYNQLDWKLRSDERVVVMEKTNFRYVTPDLLQQKKPSFATIDVSFISLKLILPVLRQLLVENSDIVALVKPQFEAGREQVGKKGVVRNKQTHVDVLTAILSFASSEGYQVEGLTYSPITGGDGNIEYLVHFGWDKANQGKVITEASLEHLITEAHYDLNAAKNDNHT